MVVGLQRHDACRREVLDDRRRRTGDQAAVPQVSQEFGGLIENPFQHEDGLGIAARERDAGGTAKRAIRVGDRVAVRVAVGKALGLGGTKVSDAGLAQLSGIKLLAWLDLNNTPVTDAGLEHLAGLKALAALYLSKTKVTAAGVAKLAKALPKCKIAWDGGTVEPKP